MLSSHSFEFVSAGHKLKTSMCDVISFAYSLVCIAGVTGCAMCVVDSVD